MLWNVIEKRHTVFFEFRRTKNLNPKKRIFSTTFPLASALKLCADSRSLRPHLPLYRPHDFFSRKITELRARRFFHTGIFTEIGIFFGLVSNSVLFFILPYLISRVGLITNRKCGSLQTIQIQCIIFEIFCNEREKCWKYSLPRACKIHA